MNNNRGGNNRRRGRSNGGGNPRPQGASGGGGQQLNRIDSRSRGNAPQMLEKFRKLAQDAHLNGDRVNAEYYLQFADHYFRVIADTRLRQEEQRLRRDDRWQENGEGERDDADESGDFSVESDFPTFDQAPVYTRREREDRPERNTERSAERPAERDAEDRDGNHAPATTEPYREEPAPRDDTQGRSGNDNRGDRASHSGNANRGDQYQPQQSRAGRNQASPAPAEEPVENLPAAANPYEPEENPFLREARGGRGLRPRREDRRPRAETAANGDAVGASDAAGTSGGNGEARSRDDRATRAVAAGIDPDTLPPAFTTRNRPVEITPAESVAVESAGEAPAPRRRARRKPTTDDAGGAVESVS